MAITISKGKEPRYKGGEEGRFTIESNVSDNEIDPSEPILDVLLVRRSEDVHYVVL